MPIVVSARLCPVLKEGLAAHSFIAETPGLPAFPRIGSGKSGFASVST